MMFQVIDYDVFGGEFMNEISCYPVTSNRWSDLEKLFGPSGAYWGCWCTYWRFTNKKFNDMKPNERKKSLIKIIEENDIAPGILAYFENKPVGWLAISPRKKFERIVKSRVIKPVDDKPVWSIVCFYIHEDFRGKGVSKELIKTAETYAEGCGASIVESYPIDSSKCKKNEKIDDSLAYVGVSSLFDTMGFVKVADTKAKSGGKPRIIMRKKL